MSSWCFLCDFPVLSCPDPIEASGVLLWFCELDIELFWSELGVELVLDDVPDVWATATAADTASTNIIINRRFLIVSPRLFERSLRSYATFSPLVGESGGRKRQQLSLEMDCHTFLGARWSPDRRSPSAEFRL